MPIRPLPALLVNQIAAGEVIERPASVVKELIDNAIDAKAMRIDVVIEEGGTELIRVSDDGGGIPMEELELAIAPHATSKISRAEDLDAIATMGFRGEALASIASVSRLSILSRPKDQPGAALLEAEGDQISRVKPAGGPPGTTIAVRNLFFNTPARRKFLRTVPTEASRIGEMVESLALSHPSIAFTLMHNGRSVIDLPGNSTPKQRVLDVLGRDDEAKYLECSADERGIALWGLIGRPELARATANAVRLYLNGRPIRDRSLHHAIKEAYRGLIEPSRHPQVVLMLEMDPGAVDVNVHPAKAEVRFRNQGQVHGTVLTAVRARLREADLTPMFQLGAARDRLQFTSLPPPPSAFTADDHGRADHSAHDSVRGSSGASSPSAFVEYFQRLDAQQKGFVYSEVKQALARDAPEVLAREVNGGDAPPGDRSHDGRPVVESPGIPGVRLLESILQVHSSYLVTQDAGGLVIIDQHALHERVMFEKLKARITTGTLESQRLLMPEAVEVDRRQMEHLGSLQPILQKIGIEADALGPQTIAVHAFPSFLFERNVEIQPFMRELIDRAADGDLPAEMEAALHEVLDMMACKAAIKAGDRLSASELEELMRYRETIERSSNCPHGRPTTLRLSIEELNRQFGRG